MRFLHVNHRYAPFVGGSENVVREVSERLARDGHEVGVVTSNAFDLEYFWNANRKAVDAPARENIGGVDVRRVDVRHVPASSVLFRGIRRLMGEASSLPLSPGLFEFFARRQPWLPDLPDALSSFGDVDLVHATNLSLEGLAVAALDEARRQNVPLVLTPFIHLGGAADARARRYVSMPHQRRLLRAAAIVITMTAMEADFVVSLGVDRARVHVTGAGINPTLASGGNGASFRARHGIRGPLVASIGTLAPDKGTIHLARAVIALRRAGHDVELALAGPALVAFERWYTQLDRRDREGIHLLGFIDETDKRNLLSAMDVFALPSRTESFGIVYLEAWANRKPVIAADSGAVSELVRHGETGMLVPFGDEAAIADAVVRLLGEPSLARRLGERGHDRLTRDYTWSHVFQRVVSAYESALGVSLRESMP